MYHLRLKHQNFLLLFWLYSHKTEYRLIIYLLKGSILTLYMSHHRNIFKWNLPLGRGTIYTTSPLPLLYNDNICEMHKMHFISASITIILLNLGGKCIQKCITFQRNSISLAEIEMLWPHTNKLPAPTTFLFELIEQIDTKIIHKMDDFFVCPKISSKKGWCL